MVSDTLSLLPVITYQTSRFRCIVMRILLLLVTFMNLSSKLDGFAFTIDGLKVRVFEKVEFSFRTAFLELLFGSDLA